MKSKNTKQFVVIYQLESRIKQLNQKEFSGIPMEDLELLARIRENGGLLIVSTDLSKSDFMAIPGADMIYFDGYITQGGSQIWKIHHKNHRHLKSYSPAGLEESFVKKICRKHQIDLKILTETDYQNFQDEGREDKQAKAMLALCPIQELHSSSKLLNMFPASSNQTWIMKKRTGKNRALSDLLEEWDMNSADIIDFTDLLSKNKPAIPAYARQNFASLNLA